jgi:hypothetical protein
VEIIIEKPIPNPVKETKPGNNRVNPNRIVVQLKN